MADQETKNLESRIGRSETFDFAYASNVQFIPSPWDLKLVFGDAVFDSTSGQPANKHHTGITLSWQQAKTMLVFLRINIEIRESSSGEIKIPKIAFGPAVQEKIPEDFTTMERAIEAIYQVIKENAPDKK